MEPDAFEIRSLIYAIEAYNDFERYGFPREGGLKGQVWVWKLAVDCVKDALAIGTAQARAEARFLPHD